MKAATEKQLKLIQDMECAINVKFKGASIIDASIFISRNMAAYKEQMEYAFDMVHNPNNY